MIKPSGEEENLKGLGLAQLQERLAFHEKSEQEANRALRKLEETDKATLRSEAAISFFYEQLSNARSDHRRVVRARQRVEAALRAFAENERYDRVVTDRVNESLRRRGR